MPSPASLLLGKNGIFCLHFLHYHFSMRCPLTLFFLSHVISCLLAAAALSPRKKIFLEYFWFNLIYSQSGKKQIASIWEDQQWWCFNRRVIILHPFNYQYWIHPLCLKGKRSVWERDSKSSFISPPDSVAQTQPAFLIIIIQIHVLWHSRKTTLDELSPHLLDSFSRFCCAFEEGGR